MIKTLIISALVLVNTGYAMKIPQPIVVRGVGQEYMFNLCGNKLSGACYVPKKNYVFISERINGTDSKFYRDHEDGHQKMGYVSQKGYDYWTKLFEQQKCTVSKYGSTDMFENFAEIYAFMKSTDNKTKSMIQRKCPKQYEFVKLFINLK